MALVCFKIVCDIILKGVGKRYSHWVFRDFTHTFRSSGTYLLVGPNGAGKSTLSRILLGFEAPSEGTVVFTGATMGWSSFSFSSPDLFLPQQLSARELGNFYCALRGGRVDVWTQELEAMGLADWQHHPISALSLGMQQRLKLGLVLFSPARVVIMDEPFSNLDSKGTAWCLGKISSILGKKLIILSEGGGDTLLDVSAEKIYLKNNCNLH